MERVIELLKEKNSYLEKFLIINEHELINVGEGNFDNIEAFYQAREKMLEQIRSTDHLILEHNSRLVSGDISQAAKFEVEGLLKAKDEWVEAILAQDLKILSFVEREKSNIIKELRTTAQARKAVGAYRGTELSYQLDEKA
jgi:hypothetical protein